MDGVMMVDLNPVQVQDMVLVEVVVPVKQVVVVTLHMQDMVVMGFKFLLLSEILPLSHHHLLVVVVWEHLVQDLLISGLLAVVAVAQKLVQLIQALHQELEQVVLVVEAEVVTMGQ